MTLNQYKSIKNELSSYEKHILKLLIVDSKSYDDIAHITGLSVDFLVQTIEKIEIKFNIN